MIHVVPIWKGPQNSGAYGRPNGFGRAFVIGLTDLEFFRKFCLPMESTDLWQEVPKICLCLSGAMALRHTHTKEITTCMLLRIFSQLYSVNMALYFWHCCKCVQLIKIRFELYIHRYKHKKIYIYKYLCTYIYIKNIRINIYIYTHHKCIYVYMYIYIYIFMIGPFCESLTLLLPCLPPALNPISRLKSWTSLDTLASANTWM